MRQFLEFVRYELVPAIRSDCEDDHIELLAAGSSIGAFNALACMCRFPDVFRAAICMSGTYDLRQFLPGEVGRRLVVVVTAALRAPRWTATRWTSCGGGSQCWPAGRAPTRTSGESWRVADVLGATGIPNRVDPWGEEWPHDWQTWRAMLPAYLDELL